MCRSDAMAGNVVRIVAAATDERQRGSSTVIARRPRQRLISSRIFSIGIASALPNRDVTVVAWKRALYTASSVASSAASKKGDIASGGSTARARAFVSLKRVRISGDVENAMAKSPLPLLYDD